MIHSKNIWCLVSLLIVLSLLVSACAPVVTATPAPTSPPTSAAVAPPTTRPTAPPTSAPAAPADPKSKDPTTSTLLIGHDPDTLDPAIDYEVNGSSILLNIYEGLITYDGPDPLKFKPQLAKTIPAPVPTANGGVQYVWNLVDGVKFHNGDPLKAHDVAFSFWRTMLIGDPNTPAYLMDQAFLNGIYDVTDLVDPTGALQGAPDELKTADPKKLAAACETVKKAVTFDDASSTVTTTLPKPWGPFMATLAGGGWAYVLDQAWVKAQGDWDGDCQTWQNFYGIPLEAGVLRSKANGTGPYMLDHWTPAEEIVLTANPAYRKGPAKISRYVIREVIEPAAHIAALKAGDADNIGLNPSIDYPIMDTLVRDECDSNTGQCVPYLDEKGQPNPAGILRRYLHVPSFNRGHYLFNTSIAPDSTFIGSGKLDGKGIPPDFFADVNIRRAFNYCFDTSTFINDAFNGEGVPGLAIELPGQPGYEGSPAFTFDLDKCAAAFKASTLKSVDGSQTLWDAGFTLQLPYAPGATFVQKPSQILAEAVHQVNPKFVISPLEIPALTYLDARNANQLPIRRAGWVEDIHDPHNWYAPFLYTAYNLLGSQQGIMAADRLAIYQQLVNDGVYEFDQSKRAAIYRQLNQMIYDDALLIVGPSGENRYYEPLYLQGWYGGQSQNPMWSMGGPYLYDFSKN